MVSRDRSADWSVANGADFTRAFRLEWPDGVTVYDPVARLRASGWLVDVSPIIAIAEQCGRPLSPALPEGMFTALLVTARKS